MYRMLQRRLLSAVKKETQTEADEHLMYLYFQLKQAGTLTDSVAAWYDREMKHFKLQRESFRGKFFEMYTSFAMGDVAPRLYVYVSNPLLPMGDAFVRIGDTLVMVDYGHYLAYLPFIRPKPNDLIEVSHQLSGSIPLPDLPIVVHKYFKACEPEYSSLLEPMKKQVFETDYNARKADEIRSCN
jgi:hypothetical protein